MKRSRQVSVTFMAAAAAAFVAGCGDEEAVCVDQDNNVVDAALCDREVDLAADRERYRLLCEDDPQFEVVNPEACDDDYVPRYWVIYGGSITGKKVKGGKRYSTFSKAVTDRGGFGRFADASGSGPRKSSGGG